MRGPVGTGEDRAHVLDGRDQRQIVIAEAPSAPHGPGQPAPDVDRGPAHALGYAPRPVVRRRQKPDQDGTAHLPLLGDDIHDLQGQALRARPPEDREQIAPHPGPQRSRGDDRLLGDEGNEGLGDLNGRGPGALPKCRAPGPQAGTGAEQDGGKTPYRTTIQETTTPSQIR